MNYQGGFETFREATRYMFETPSISDILFVLLGLSFVVVVLIVFPYLLSKYRARADLKKEFFATAKSFGLTEAESALLWRCAGMTKEPFKLLQSKSLFERCTSKIIREDLSKIETLSQIRKKLRFDNLPWFLPLSSTRELDMYQTGFVTIDKNAYSTAVWNKNELELHLALLEDPPKPLKEGDRIKFSFLRESDGRYYIQGEVKRVYKDGTKLIIVLPHTENLSKIQLRETLRWKVKIPAKVFIYHEKHTVPGEPEDMVEALIEDISPKGVRVCLSGGVQAKEEEKIYMKFTLRSQTFSLMGTIRNTRFGMGKACLGVSFDNLPKSDEDFIRKFILDEQRELLKAYKLGEVKEDSSS